ncbi:hypothetical protein ACFSUI_00275 [Ralstonia solanacearum]
MGKLFTLKDEAEKRSKRIVIRVTMDEEAKIKELLPCGRWTSLSSRVVRLWAAKRMWTTKLKQCSH